MDRLNSKLLFEDLQKSYRTIGEKYRSDAYKAFDYLCRADSIFRMTCAIDMGLQPLNGVCRYLENIVDCSNPHLRQLIGLEIRYILSIFGYVLDGSKDRQALRKNCKGKYFKTGAFYVQVRKSIYTLHVGIGEVK